MIEPFVSTRQANKEKRRRRILDAAREILTEKGYEALNTRDLAKAAGVTTPTLYNLVGNKDAILLQLSLASIGELEQTLNELSSDDALGFIEGIVNESLKLIEGDDSFFRGSMIAMYQLSQEGSEATPEQRYAARCTEVAIHGCELAEAQGLLLGNISAATLGEQLYSAFCAPFREWIYRRLGPEAFREKALRGFYMCLCSDATPAFLATLRSKLQALPESQTLHEPDCQTG